LICKFAAPFDLPPTRVQIVGMNFNHRKELKNE